MSLRRAKCVDKRLQPVAFRKQAEDEEPLKKGHKMQRRVSLRRLTRRTDVRLLIEAKRVLRGVAVDATDWAEAMIVSSDVV